MKPKPPYRPHEPKNNVENVRGTVQVRVTLVETGGKVVKGNIIRSFTVADATVAEVIGHLRLALFGKEDEATG